MSILDKNSMSHFLKGKIYHSHSDDYTNCPTILPEIISAKCDLNLEFVQCALLHFLIFTTSFLVAKLNFASAGVFFNIG